MTEAAPKPKRKYTIRARCQICQHAERATIELMHLADVPLDRIAARFGVHRDSIWRHAQNHMSEEQRNALLIGPARLGSLIETAAEESGNVLQHYQLIRSILFRQLTQLAEKNDASGVSLVASRLIHVLRDVGKLTGEIREFATSTVINVTQNAVILNSPPFSDLQTGLLEVCSRHPEARADILGLLRGLDEKYSQKPQPASPMREIEGVAIHG